MTTASAHTPWRLHVAVNLLYLGFQFQDAALFTIILPLIVLRLAGTSHVAMYATLATVATAVGTLTPSAAGWLSDRVQRTGVARPAQMAAIVVLDIIALAIIAGASSPVMLGAGVAIAAISVAGGETVYQAILPEVIERPDWGLSTGVRGAVTLVGATIGFLAAGYFSPADAILANAVILVLTSVSLMWIPRRTAAHEVAHRPIVTDRRDLVVMMIVRGFMVLGMGLFVTYGVYFFHDVLRVTDAPERAGITAITALAGAVISSLLCGVLPNRVDRRHVVAAAGCAMGAAGFGFAFDPNPSDLIACAAILGVGLGAIYSAGFVLVLSALPSATDIGRDLGHWATISGLPAIAAPALGALILAHAHDRAPGYEAVFGSASVAFALAGLSALAVRRHNVTAPSASHPPGRPARRRCERAGSRRYRTSTTRCRCRAHRRR